MEVKKTCVVVICLLLFRSLYRFYSLVYVDACNSYYFTTNRFIVLSRVQDVAELLGMMVEDHKRLQPNMRTYA